MLGRMNMRPSPGPDLERRDGRRGVLIGATGLVGRLVVDHLIAMPEVGELITITRRPLEIQEHPRLTQMIIPNFSTLADLDLPRPLDFAISCLGSTRKQAGSAENFRRIDYDFNLAFAKLARSRDVHHYLLLSAGGVSKNSPFLYPRVKGELEESVRELNFPALTIFRPGLLMGERQEYRAAESVMIHLTRGLGRVFGPASVRSFATDVEGLASRIARDALAPSPPSFTLLESRAL